MKIYNSQKTILRDVRKSTSMHNVYATFKLKYGKENEKKISKESKYRYKWNI